MKALSKKLLVISAMVGLVFFSCDKRTAEEKWESEIRSFFYEYKDDAQVYVPLRYQKIDLAFLADQAPIQKALLVLQDTTRQRVRQLHLANLSHQVEGISTFMQPFQIDRVDDYLKLRASAEGELSRKGKSYSEAYQLALANEQLALSELEHLLGQFNLSIYSIDFENNPVIYFHEYIMDDEDRSAIFELDRENGSVVSFREIS